MQTAIVETFQSTMNKCFATVVEDILGRTVKEEIFLLLSRNGIRTSEIASRFDDVVGVLTSAFGDGARVLVFKTVTELQEVFPASRFQFRRVSERPDHTVEGESGHGPSEAQDIILASTTRSIPHRGSHRNNSPDPHFPPPKID